MDVLKERAEAEQEAFEKEWAVIADMMQNKIPYDKDYLKKLHLTTRRASVSGAEIITEQAIEEEESELTQLGDMSKEEELALKKRHVKNLWRYAYDKVSNNERSVSLFFVRE